MNFSSSTNQPAWRWFQTLIAAHPSVTEPDKRRDAELISALSLGFITVLMLALAVVWITGIGDISTFGSSFLLLVVAFFSYLLSRTSRYTRSIYVFVIGFALLAYPITLFYVLPSQAFLIILSLAFLLGNLLGLRQMAALIGINIFLGTGFALIFLPQVRGLELATMLSGIAFIGLFALIFAWHRSALERLRLQEVQNAQQSLEQSYQALQQAQQQVNARLQEIQLAAQVSRAVAQVRDLNELLADAVETIRQTFDLYYVQVYLINPAQTHLVLQAGTGEVGQQLKMRRHRLPLDQNSINGRAALERTPQVISDTTRSPVFKPNPLLPQTRSEMAVPLIAAERVIGVLDMQSDQPNALNPETLPAFEALAGQIAIAIENANLLAETQQARAEAERAARRLEQRNWQEYLDAIHKPQRLAFALQNDQIQPLSDAAPLPDEAIVAPLEVAGLHLGDLAVELPAQNRTPQAAELIQRVARQAAEHLENLRLLESAERYRAQAEAASRRLTREGWEEYFRQQAGQSLGYLYDSKQVKPYSPSESIETQSALVLPIKVRDETIGKLALLEADSADPQTLELVNAVLERLSAHIENLRLLEETQRGQIELNKRARQLAAVSQISTVSARELDVQKMLAVVVQMTQREFGLYHAHVFTYDDRAQLLQIIACGWKAGDEHEGTHGTTTIAINQEQSLVARAARTRQPVVVNDVRSDPGWLPNPLLPDTRSELAVPLLIGDELLGVLDVQSDEINHFTEEDVSIQTTLAAQVATALQNARSFARAQKQAEREALLNAISQKIQSATSVEAVLQIAARELGHALGAPRAIAQLSLKK